LFERFSEPTRQVVVIASDEARALSHDYIGTEHLLLGLLREPGGRAQAILRSLDLTAERARAEVIEIVGYGAADAGSQMPFTPRAVRVLQLAAAEALRVGRADADTEHVLLALIDEGEGIGARVLRDAGADARAIRALVTDMAGGLHPSSDVVGPPGPEAIGEVEVDLGWRGRSIALAALGAAVVGRSAFDPRRTGDLFPIEMQLLAYLELGARDGATVESGENIDSLVSALACDLDDVRVAVISLMRAGLLAAPMGDDDDRVVITPEGTVRVQEWLRRTVSLFGGWPPTVPGVDDV